MTIIQTSARFNILSCFLYGLGTMVLIALVLIPLDTSFDSNEDILAMLVSLVIFGFIGIFSLRMILWFILGGEVIKIKNGNLIILKTGSFWVKRRKIIPLKSIQHITTSGNFYERNSPSTLVGLFSRQMYIFKIQNTGRLVVKVKQGKSHRFLDNTSFEEAKEVKKKIESFQP